MDPQTDTTPVVVPIPISSARSAGVPDRSAEAAEAYAAYAPDSLADPAPVTGGRGVEVDDIVEMLAELRFLQELDRLL